MRKSMKRVVVLLLTVCLLAGYAMPVLAMETGDSTQEDPGQVQVDPESTEKPAETPAATAAEGQQDPTEEPTQAPEETPAASAEENEEEQPSAEPTQSTEPAPTEEAKEESVPQPVSYPAAPAEEQDVSGKMFVAKQGVDAVYSMFKIEKATAVKVGDTIYATVFVNPTAKGVFTYSYLYFGTRTALVDQLDKGGAFDVVIGASDGEKQAYHFTLPASAAGTRVPVCVLKSDLTARSAYNSSELELIVPADIPEGKLEAVPNPVNYPAAPAEEQDVSGKMFVAKQGADAVYSMFKIEKATAVKVGDTIYATVFVNPTAKGVFTYSYLYFGTRTALVDQLDKGGAFDVVIGASDGEKQAYHFTLPASAAGTRVPVCVLKSDLTARNAYNSSELELIVPADIPEGKLEAVPNPVNYPAAPAEEQDVSGKMFVAKQGADAVYSMFKIEKATAVKVGDTIYATVFVNPTAKGVFTYSYLYFGTRTALVDQLDKGGAFDVVIGASDGEKQAYHFTLPASAAGTRVPVCVLKSDLTARSAYNSSELELIVPADIPEGKLEAVPNPVNYPAAPAEEQDVSGKMFVAKQGADAVYSMFKIEKATAVKVGDTIYATVFVNPTAKGVFTYSYLYFGTRTALVDQLDKGGAFDVVIGASDGEKQAYHFTLPASAAGTRVPVCVLKSDLTARSAYNSSELELIVPADIPEGVQEPDPTPVASPAIPKLPDDLQEAGIQVLKVEDNAEFKMLAAAKTGMVVVGSKKLLIHFETANVSYDRLYFGAKEDTVKSPYIQGTARADGGWIFEFEVPYSYRGNKNPICLGKPDGTWYTGKDLVLSIPADGPCDTGTELSDAGIKMLAGGSDVEQSFKIDSSSAMRLGNSIYCTINGRAAGNNSAKTVDKLYLGSRDDKDKSGYVNGVVQEDGSTTFTFVVSADKQGVCIPAVVGFTTGGWDTTQSYFLNIPNFGRKFSLAYYTEGVYDLFGNAYAALQRSNNRSFPVDTDSTLTVSGDTITIKWVCRSKSYDKLYFGLLSADEATREAQAVTSSDYTPIGFGYRVYYITLSKSVLGSPIPFLRHSSSGWMETQDYLVLTDYLPRSSAAPVDPTDPDPTDPDKKISDGVYNAAAETGSAMFKVLKAVLHVKDGKYQVTLTLSGTGYDYLYAGTAAQAESADKSTWAPAKLVNCTLGGETRDFYTYTLSVEDPTKPIAVASHSQKQDKWYDRSVTLDLSSLKRTAADGKYTVTAQCDASMFKVISAKLDVINGEMMAVLTLSGTGYDYLYAGTSEEAEKDKDNWASFQPDNEGKYTYTIPVSELDKPLTVASHSQKQDKWYDRTVTFLSDSLVKVGEAEDPVKPTPAPTPTPTPTDPEKPDDESKSDNDTNGSTSKVDNSTTLKDGTYTPDGFSFSGGSGRARIICNKVTVKNGKAYATIQFVSASGSPTAYAYVKASGKIYYPTGTSTFTIPVELNKNNRILGMTTKMSAAHEIEYTIFVQLKTGENAAENPENTGSNLSAQAPEIMGLTFKEEIQLEHAAYLKLFRYEGDIVLAEIDLTRDTVLDTDEALEALAEADELAAQEKKASASSEEESTDTAQIKADYVAALYKKDVLRYLLVPADAELPAGLEKEYLILTVPPKSIYLMDEEAEGTLEALNALELIKVLGVQTTENEVLKAGLADGSVLFGGSWDAPDYKMLVRAKTDLALASGKLLPLSDEVLAERKQEKGADREELTAVEYRNRLYELADRFAVLDIPLLIDRSADEKDALAQADWLRLYGVLMGQEKAAEEMIRKLAAQEGNV